MKRIIIYGILAITLFSCIGCNENRTALNDGTDKIEVYNTNISYEPNEETKKEIDMYVSAEGTWAYDVADPGAVLENTDYFVKVRVKTKEKTKYFVKNKIMPSSTYNIEVLEVISPENAALPKNIKNAVGGGTVSMEEYLDTLDLETKEKIEIEKLSKKDMQKLIMISDESYFELEQGNEYYICIRDLTQDENYKGYYGMPEGGYDVFQEEDGKYVNVLTKRQL